MIEPGELLHPLERLVERQMWNTGRDSLSWGYTDNTVIIRSNTAQHSLLMVPKCHLLGTPAPNNVASTTTLVLQFGSCEFSSARDVAWSLVM